MAVSSARRFLGIGFVAAAILAGSGTVVAIAAGPAPKFTVTPGGVSDLGTPQKIAEILAGPGVTVTDSEINLTASPTSDVLPSFGEFLNGNDDLGISDGLIIAANADAASFATNAFSDQIATIRSGNLVSGPEDAQALAAVTNAAGLGSTVNNVTSMGFSVAPPAPGEGRYLKFEYSLLITEFGSWNAGSSTWGGDVFGYPDGFALFVGGTAVSNNCAVVPQTSTYLSMSTAGIVDPAASFADGRADALARLAARVADPDNPPSTPNGFAYPTGELVEGVYQSNNDWTVKFLTVPLTCVYDAQTEITAGDPIPVQIVVADLNDTAIPPAVVFKGSSLRWSDSPTPAEEFALTVSKSGSGTGTITSTPSGINCGATCRANFTAGSSVTLAAAPASGSTFTGWSGACSGTGPCTVTMSEARTVTAAFAGSTPGPAPGPGPAPEPTPTPTPTVTPEPPSLDPITGAQNTNLPAGGLPLGESVLLINGVPTVVTVRPDSTINPTGLIIEGPGFILRLDGRSPGDQPLPLTADGALILEQNGTTFTVGTGFDPQSFVYVWLFSEPRLLGTLTVDANGAFRGTVPLPADVPVGRHTLQVNGLTPEGKVRSLSLGVQVNPANSPSGSRKAKAKTTVYFASGSAALNASAKKSLNALVKGRKKTVTRIVVNGFVQGTNATANDQSLSRARATTIARYLKSQGVTGKVVVQAKGVAKETGAAGRKAVVRITYQR
jgi:outer membrane protein OmpA-like peptidoglycan-associated protein